MWGNVEPRLVDDVVLAVYFDLACELAIVRVTARALQHQLERTGDGENRVEACCSIIEQVQIIEDMLIQMLDAASTEHQRDSDCRTVSP